MQQYIIDIICKIVRNLKKGRNRKKRKEKHSSSSDGTGDR